MLFFFFDNLDGEKHAKIGKYQEYFSSLFAGGHIKHEFRIHFDQYCTFIGIVAGEVLRAAAVLRTRGKDKQGNSYPRGETIKDIFNFNNVLKICQNYFIFVLKCF